MRQFDSLLLDANCLLNLYATDCLREITLALSFRFWVTDYVVKQEALFIVQHDLTENKYLREPVDLTPLIEERQIQLMSLENPEEEATFVNLAVHLDDGEAITGALAFHRDCSIATDDRKARRILSQYAPSIELFSTLELLKLWAEEAQVPKEELRTTMAQMRSRASYVPGTRDSLYHWWRSIVCRSET